MGNYISNLFRTSTNQNKIILCAGIALIALALFFLILFQIKKHRVRRRIRSIRNRKVCATTKSLRKY